VSDINISLTVEQVNSLVNILNTPYQVPTVVLFNFITLIQEQAEPQFKELEATRQAIADALAKQGKEVPKDGE